MLRVVIETKPNPSSSAAGEGGALPTPPSGSNAQTAPPPAARIVVTAERTEREANLEAELATERSSHAATAAQKKERELRLSELEDQLHRLRQPAPQKKKDSWWFDP